ncbi:hypothetical protein BDN70DRAFT_996181 [Pholiota conissans]|uniref:Csf1 N-terminal domain-containing protein n=1 Tax=Pholiota conissans TaxID=109636 RepID=A0A9P5YUN7_9AGAR|nr:hypothetical protein BDN70DRAFT_996181 [Pholiota conissans]
MVEFNRLLLVACISVVVALILYFFYWNRFLGFIIGQTIRVLLWNQDGSSLWVEIGSIHFSLLTGRILLKDIRYHSSNQTIKIVTGQIQWRYWTRYPTTEEEIDSIRGDDTKSSARLLSCRIQLSLRGLEWFVYNRTASYDNIVDQIEKMNRPNSRSSSHRRFFQRFSRQDNQSPYNPPSLVRSAFHVPATFRKGFAWFRGQLPTLDPKDLLPLGIHVQTGAIILGNPSTPTLLVAEFQDALGTYGITASRSKYDLYKQILGLKLQNTLFHLVQNDDYVDPMASLGSLVHTGIKRHLTSRIPSTYQSHRVFMKLWRQFGLYKLITEYFTTRRSQRAAHHPSTSFLLFHKQKKIVDEDTPIGIDFSTFEYAIERRILEAPSLELTYYVDAVGEVPADPVDPRYAGGGIHDIGNGDTSPEWGFDLVVYGGTLRYGPWADRQRAELQRAFFPPTYRDSEVTPRLKVGDKRMWTSLQVFIELRDETCMYVPFRESSKDWQWDGITPIPQRPRRREAATINVVVGDRSSINYIMPMVIGPSGYESTLEVHLDTVAITSSLNDIKLISSESSRVRCELPSSLRWDAERTWLIALYLRQPVLYLLRDHINMFTDLGKDWVSGPPTDYQKFIPMIYLFRLEMHHFELNCYANDQNIVDKPLVREENALVTLKGPHLKSLTTIPLSEFRPEMTSISFDVVANDLVVNISLPRWNTHASHMPSDGVSLLRTVSFSLEGSYLYFATVHQENVEQLRLDFTLNDAIFHAYGWSIRYLMVLRDNFLGSFTHFQTLAEYLDKRTRKLPIGDPVQLKYRPGKANMFEVALMLRATGIKVTLPMVLIGPSNNTQSIPGANLTPEICNQVILKCPDIQLQLRMHDYCMEMALNTDIVMGVISQDDLEPSTAKRCIGTEILMIDGIDITANRLFGPQPRTATYICIWEIAIGKVKASLTAQEAQILVAAANSFIINFVDLLNAPAEEFMPVVDLDVTFYKITSQPIEILWKAGNAALVLNVPYGLKFDSNDLGARKYRKVTSLRIPNILASILLTTVAERNTWLQAAELAFDMYLDIYSSPLGYRSITRDQLAFVEEQDKITNRAKTMFSQLRQHTKVNLYSDRISHKNRVYIPQPTLPNLATRIPRPTETKRGPVYGTRAPSWRLSNVADLSDSDSEELISEVDRDARLARTRTSTPVARVPEDDVTLSSGDESDDADLTDGESTGDEWSDLNDSAHGPVTSSLMSFYSTISKRYVGNWFHGRQTWEEPPYTLIKNGTTVLNCESPESFNEIFVDSVPFELPEDVPKDENVTTFRARSTKAIRLSFNPLILPAVVTFEKDIKNIVLDPKMCIDALLARSITEATKKQSPRCIIVDLHWPHATVQVMHHISMLNGQPNVTNAMELIGSPSNLDILSVVTLSLDGFRLASISGEKLSSIRMSLQRAAVVLNTPIDKRSLSGQIKSNMLEVVLSSVSLRLSQRVLSTNFDGITLEIGHRGPGLVAATGFALFNTGSAILQLGKSVSTHRTAIQRSMIANAMQTSEQQSLIDPLSTIQPSFLVQSGKPHRLRTDVTFRFLYHLQNCLLNLQDSTRPPDAFPANLDMEGFVAAVESRLASLDPDASNIGHLPSLKYLFLHKESKLRKTGGRSIRQFSVHCRNTTATILDPGGSSSSQLSIDDLGVSLHTKSCDLAQINFSNLYNTSQSSLRSKPVKTVQKLLLVVSFGDITLVVSPQLMHFAQHILRLQKQFSFDPTTNQKLGELADKFPTYSSKLYYLEAAGRIRRLRIQAAAENLILVMGINGLQTSSTMLLSSKQLIRSSQQSVLFDKIYLEARSPADLQKVTDLDILAALAFTDGRISAIHRLDSASKSNMKLVLVLESVRLHVPRSALRLYHFIGQWRAEYLPGMEAALKTLFTEYKSGPMSPTPSRQSSRSSIQLHGQINHFEIALQIMHGTWLSWEVHKTITYTQSSGSLMASQVHAFGLQIASITLNVSSKPDSGEVASSSRVKLVLPPLSLAGTSDESTVQALVLFEFIELKVKPSHWDTLLAVQQKFGQDFNDLVALIQKTRQDGTSQAKPHVPRSSDLRYEAHLKMRGFRVGLEGASSTVLLESQDINGGISNALGWSWDVGLSNLALSLAPRTSNRQKTSFNRNHRSAFVTIDFKFIGSTAETSSNKTLRLSVTKIHAVMQPSSIGEFGDFIDNLQVELVERQEQRALELATFKEKTQRILKTFDISTGEVPLEKRSLINDLVISVSIHKVAVAFPLTHDEELELPYHRSKESPSVRAFLFSIKSIEFETHKGETGQAIMQHLSFQFVSRFRQSSPEDFAAETHFTRNWLLYPEMKARLRSSSVGPSRKIWIKADVTGFILDIDSTISSYVFALIDVYRQGKERVERLSASAPRTPLTAAPSPEIAKPSVEKRYTAVPTSNIFSQLVFRSGKVRLYSGSASNQFKTKILSSNNFLDILDEQILALGAEVFNLPTVSVWGEYRATSAMQKVFKDAEQQPSLLMFNSTVYSSQNTLRPSLLPFLTELINHIELRMRKVSSRTPGPPPLISLPSNSSVAPKNEDIENVSSMQICFSLQIDKSKLELTCQPDVNVVAGLNWESGGFVVNVSPGARKVSFFGGVGGLTIGLKHGFLSDDCVKLDARNLTFSVALIKMESEAEHTVNSISIILETEFLGIVRFSRLQDILCFKAVWLDRIPIFNNQSAAEPKTPQLSVTTLPIDPSLPQKQNSFATVVLLRIRKVQLEIDLGQSITKIKLDLHQSVFRTKLTDDFKEVLLHIGDVTVVAQGNLSGYASVSSCVFQTIRRSEDMLQTGNGRSKLLELRLTSGTLTASLDSDHQQLLYYRAKPLEVEIFDDWSKIPRVEDETRPLQLSFTIKCAEIIAIVTVGTIPKLLSYLNKFKANLDSQRQGAARESQTFRVTRTPKPDNPLSTVAEAMLHSARSRFKEAESDLSFVIKQHMNLQLELLRLIVFPRSMRDLEIAQFIGQDVHARLDGLVGPDATATKRDLHLSFSSMVISKYTQSSHLIHLPLKQPDEQEQGHWLANMFKDATEATIVGLPSMKMHMISEELLENSTRVLVYNFYSKFIRREGMKAVEDIYITLNMSLYSWLTVLRKNLTREMEQVRATEDWRTSIGTVFNAMGSTGSQRKKKVPIPLSLTDSPRSSTLPSGAAVSVSPASARLGWMEQAKSPLSAREQLLSPPMLASPLSNLEFPTSKEEYQEQPAEGVVKRSTITYKPQNRHIERLTMRQLGEATPDVMHPFFMKKAGFNLEDSLPQYINEYAAMPLEEILEVLLKLYSQQLPTGSRKEKGHGDLEYMHNAHKHIN